MRGAEEVDSVVGFSDGRAAYAAQRVGIWFWRGLAVREHYSEVLLGY